MFDKCGRRVGDGTSCSTAPVEACDLIKTAHEEETLASAWTDALTSLAEDVTSMPSVDTDGPSKLVNVDLFDESQMSGTFSPEETGELISAASEAETMKSVKTAGRSGDMYRTCVAYNGGESGGCLDIKVNIDEDWCISW
jgi:hypothetical protein